jgi:VanZ family protein
MTVNHKLKPALSWLAVLLFMLAIYFLSAHPAGISNAYSKGIVAFLVENALKLTGKAITEQDMLKLISEVNSVAREYMHGVVFFVLGMLVHNAVRQCGARGVKAVAAALAICVVYGITDEIHQILVPGRAFQLSDLVMDAAGSVIGICVVWALYRKEKDLSG